MSSVRFKQLQPLKCLHDFDDDDDDDDVVDDDDDDVVVVVDDDDRGGGREEGRGRAVNADGDEGYRLVFVVGVEMYVKMAMMEGNWAGTAVVDVAFAACD